jgi:hypothetical protein
MEATALRFKGLNPPTQWVRIASLTAPFFHVECTVTLRRSLPQLSLIKSPCWSPPERATNNTKWRYEVACYT